jgi:hypothetical protein
VKGIDVMEKEAQVLRISHNSLRHKAAGALLSAYAEA